MASKDWERKCKEQKKPTNQLEEKKQEASKKYSKEKKRKREARGEKKSNATGSRTATERTKQLLSHSQEEWLAEENLK